MLRGVGMCRQKPVSVSTPCAFMRRLAALTPAGMCQRGRHMLARVAYRKLLTAHADSPGSTERLRDLAKHQQIPSVWCDVAYRIARARRDHPANLEAMRRIAGHCAVSLVSASHCIVLADAITLNTSQNETKKGDENAERKIKKTSRLARFALQRMVLLRS